MKRCEDFQDDLAGLLAGEIDAAARRSLGEHLRACPACRDDAAGLKEVVALVGEDAVPEPGPAYWSTFGDRLRARIAAARARTGARTILAAAAALVVLAGLALLARTAPVGRPQGPAPGVARSIAGPPEDDETRFEALLSHATSREEGRRALGVILDEMVPGDPLELEEGLGAMSPEEMENMTRDLSATGS